MRVVVTQPYVPTYRVPLFSRISRLLEQQGHSFAVAAEQPRGEQAKRNDSVDAPWLTPMAHASAPAATRALRRRLPLELASPDVLVTELDVKNPLAWSRHRAEAQRVVLWGHGRSYVSRPSPVAEALRARIAARADRVMTYSTGGRDYLVEKGGLDPARVVAIGNATDTSSLLAGAVAAREDGFASRMRDELGGGPHALFVGGLDSSKRIPFLLEAACALNALAPGSKLIVCGDGQMRGAVLAAEEFGYVKYVGPRSGVELGRYAAAASAIWMPGRVGLVAVDAIALRMPLLTTPYEWHAPEFELLCEGDVARLPDDPCQFAAHALDVMSGTRALPPVHADPVTIDNVASNFVDAVTRWG